LDVARTSRESLWLRLFDERLDEFERKLEGPLHNPSEFGADSRGVEGNYLGVIQVPMDLLAEGSRNRSEDSANE
jgi:hypothetical protein